MTIQEITKSRGFRIGILSGILAGIIVNKYYVKSETKIPDLQFVGITAALGGLAGLILESATKVPVKNKVK